MKKLFLILPLVLLLTGCVYLVVGGIGALGGYVISPDTVEGIAAHDNISMWDAAMEVVPIMGVIQESSESAGIIIAKINKAKVIVTITRLTDSSSKLRVKARRYKMPRIAVAQEVYVKIMSQISQ